MTIIVLTNCPVGLRGYLTRWLLEISAGVFIGNPSARIRDILWTEVQQYAGQGRALLAYTTTNEQGYAFRTHEHSWNPIDHEGLMLIHRPEAPQPVSAAPKAGWSRAAKRRRYGGG
ncbi:type I-E CRISPR-associated endoribonuclease Cas2e [Streptomyces lavendulocolor]|uniref:type I-E CRISPR-associated endoribonuclease Cas2e n=1 Tax=Streptomyces lavendulocolor TaxID=67316 RepID=UPI003C2FEE8A